MTRTAKLPPPYPGESLYSVLCRYHVWEKNTPSRTFRELFGARTPKKDLPSSLVSPNILMRSKNGLRTIDASTKRTLALNHSAFQLYSLSLSKKQVQEYIDSLDTASPRGSMLPISYLGKQNRICFCPQCAQEEKKLYGEPYWHTLHQIKGVEFCPTHKVPLAVGVVLGKEEGWSFYPAYFYAKGSANEKHPFGAAKKKLIYLAEDVNWLLNNGMKLGGHCVMAEKYIGRIMQSQNINDLEACSEKQLDSVALQADHEVKTREFQELCRLLDLPLEKCFSIIGRYYKVFGLMQLQHAIYLRMYYGGAQSFYERNY